MKLALLGLIAQLYLVTQSAVAQPQTANGFLPGQSPGAKRALL